MLYLKDYKVNSVLYQCSHYLFFLKSLCSCSLYMTSQAVTMDDPLESPENTYEFLFEKPGLSFEEHHDKKHGRWYSFKIGFVGHVGFTEEDIMWPCKVSRDLFILLLFYFSFLCSLPVTALSFCSHLSNSLALTHFHVTR